MFNLILSYNCCNLISIIIIFCQRVQLLRRLLLTEPLSFLNCKRELFLKLIEAFVRGQIKTIEAK
jgi:hypothetical protein